MADGVNIDEPTVPNKWEQMAIDQEKQRQQFPNKWEQMAIDQEKQRQPITAEAPPTTPIAPEGFRPYAQQLIPIGDIEVPSVTPNLYQKENSSLQSPRFVSPTKEIKKDSVAEEGDYIFNAKSLFETTPQPIKEYETAHPYSYTRSQQEAERYEALPNFDDVKSRIYNSVLTNPIMDKEENRHKLYNVFVENKYPQEDILRIARYGESLFANKTRLQGAYAKYKENPADAEANYQLGAIYSTIENEELRAKNFLITATELNPQDARPLYALGYLYTKKGNNILGGDYFEQAKAIEPSPRNLLASAFSKYSYGDYKSALEETNSAIATISQTQEEEISYPYFYRASINYALGNKKEATNDLKKAKMLASLEEMQSEQDPSMTQSGMGYGGISYETSQSKYLNDIANMMEGLFTGGASLEDPSMRNLFFLFNPVGGIATRTGMGIAQMTMSGIENLKKSYEIGTEPFRKILEIEEKIKNKEITYEQARAELSQSAGIEPIVTAGLTLFSGVAELAFSGFGVLSPVSSAIFFSVADIGPAKISEWLFSSATQALSLVGYEPKSRLEEALVKNVDIIVSIFILHKINAVAKGISTKTDYVLDKIFKKINDKDQLTQQEIQAMSGLLNKETSLKVLSDITEKTDKTKEDFVNEKLAEKGEMTTEQFNETKELLGEFYDKKSEITKAIVKIPKVELPAVVPPTEVVPPPAVVPEVILGKDMWMTAQKGVWKTSYGDTFFKTEQEARDFVIKAKTPIDYSNIIAYHGTNATFDVFKSNVGGGSPGTIFQGHYFTDTPESASMFGDIIKQVKISAKNPLIIDYQKYSGNYRDLQQELSDISKSSLPSEDLIGAIEKGNIKKWDVAIIKNTDYEGTKPFTEYIIKNPKNITQVVPEVVPPAEVKVEVPKKAEVPPEVLADYPDLQKEVKPAVKGVPKAVEPAEAVAPSVAEVPKELEVAYKKGQRLKEIINTMPEGYSKSLEVADRNFPEAKKLYHEIAEDIIKYDEVSPGSMSVVEDFINMGKYTKSSELLTSGGGAGKKEIQIGDATVKWISSDNKFDTIEIKIGDKSYETYLSRNHRRVHPTEEVAEIVKEKKEHYELTKHLDKIIPKDQLWWFSDLFIKKPEDILTKFNKMQTRSKEWLEKLKNYDIKKLKKEMSEQEITQEKLNNIKKSHEKVLKLDIKDILPPQTPHTVPPVAQKEAIPPVSAEKRGIVSEKREIAKEPYQMTKREVSFQKYYGISSVPYNYKGKEVSIAGLPKEKFVVYQTKSGWLLSSINKNNKVTQDYGGEIAGMGRKGYATPKKAIEEGYKEVLAEYPELQREVKPIEIPKELESLAVEAMKYKTAEEFVQAYFDTKFKTALDNVSGLKIKDKIPNQNSISATFGNDYKVLPGVREIPMSEFGKPDLPTDRVRKLADEITRSGEINPLIVAIGKDQLPYILEGGHRFDALSFLNKKSMPAKVVLDTRGLESSQLTDFYNKVKKGEKITTEAVPEAKPTPPEVAPKAKIPAEATIYTPRGRYVFKDENMAEEIAKENLVYEKITSAKSYPKLLAAKKRFLRSLYYGDEIIKKIKEIEESPWELLSSSSHVMNRKSQSAKTMQLLENDIYKETKLPRKPKGEFRGEDCLDWDKIKIAKEVTGIPKELEPLAVEARKYKSAEEFINSKLGNSEEMAKKITQMAQKEEISPSTAIESLTGLYTKASDVLPSLDRMFAEGKKDVKNLDVVYAIERQLTDFYNQAVKDIPPGVTQSGKVPFLASIKTKPSKNITLVEAHKTLGKTSHLPILNNMNVVNGYMHGTNLDVGFNIKTDLPDGAYQPIGKNLEKSLDKTAHENFPIPPSEVNSKQVATFNKDNLIYELERANRSISKKYGGPNLQSVAIQIKDGRAKIISTDSYRISVSNLQGKFDVSDGEYLISSPQRIVKLLKALQGDNIQLIEGKDALFFVGENGNVYSRKIPDKYPGIDKVIPQFTKQIVIDKASLQKGLEEIRPYTKPGGKDTKEPLSLNVNEKGITFNSNYSGNEGIQKSIEIPSTKFKETSPVKPEIGETIMLLGDGDGINAQFLSDALKNVKGNNVVLQYDGLFPSTRLSTGLSTKSVIHIQGEPPLSLKAATKEIPTKIAPTKPTLKEKIAIKKEAVKGTLDELAKSFANIKELTKEEGEKLFPLLKKATHEIADLLILKGEYSAEKLIAELKRQVGKFHDFIDANRDKLLEEVKIKELPTEQKVGLPTEQKVGLPTEQKVGLPTEQKVEAPKEEATATLAAIDTIIQKGTDDISKQKTNLSNYIKDLDIKGKLSPQQTKSLLQNILSIKDTNGVKNFKSLAEKIITNVNYAKDLSVAKENISKVRKFKKSKLTLVNHEAVLSNILKINVRKIPPDLLLEYNKKITEYLSSFANIKSERYKMMDTREISDYLSKTQEKILKYTADNLLSDNNLTREKLGNLTDKEIIDVFKEDFDENFAKNLDDAKKTKAIFIFRELAQNKKEELSLYDTAPLGTPHKRIVKDLMNIDITKLSNEQIRNYVNVVDNIITNDSFAGARKIVCYKKAIAGMKESLITNIGNKLKTLFGSTMDTQSLPLMIRTIFSNPVLISKIEVSMGMHNFFKGITALRTEVDNITKKYNERKKELSKIDKEINSNENVTARFMLGWVARYSPVSDKSIAEQFEINKNMLLENLLVKKQTTEHKEQGILEEKIFNTILAKAIDINETKALFKKHYPASYEMWDFLTHKLLPTISPRAKINTEEFYNELWDKDVDYSPIKYIKLLGDLIPDTQRPAYLSDMPPSPKQAPNTILRKKYETLPKGYVLDPNFDRNVLRSMEKTLYDIHTSEAIEQMKAFMNLPEAQQLFGSTKNIKLINEKLNKINEEYRNVGYNKQGVYKLIRAASTIARRYSITRAIGGFIQVIKQGVVSVNTMINLGKDVDLFGKSLLQVAKAEKLLNLYSVGRRGKILGGAEIDMDVYNKSNEFAKGMIDNVTNKMLKGSEAVQGVYLTPLAFSDKNIAKASWLSYYQKYLRKNGIDVKDIDWNAEARLQKTDRIRQEASAYAEHMVDITQLPSDPSKLAEILKSKDNITKTIFRDQFLPFVSYNIGQKGRIINDINDIRTGRNPRYAWQSLTGTIAEIVVYQAVAVYLVDEIKKGGVDMLYAMFNIDVKEKTEEELKEELAFKWKRAYSNILRDITVGGLGGFAEDISMDGFNRAAYFIGCIGNMDYVKKEVALREEKKDMTYEEWIKENKQPLYRYGILRDKSSRGLYDVITNQVEVLGKQAKIYSKDENKQISSEYDKLTEEEKNYVNFASFMIALDIANLSDADVTRIVKMGQKRILKKPKEMTLEERKKQWEEKKKKQ